MVEVRVPVLAASLRHGRSHHYSRQTSSLQGQKGEIREEISEGQMHRRSV